MTTISTLFSGGEGVGVGAKMAGLDHLWGVEYIDEIAQVARANGFNTITGNVMDTALMMSLPRPDVLPDKARLACTVIGNSVPPLLYKAVIEAQR